MKRISLFLAVLLMLVFFAACSNKKTPASQKPEYTFSHQDSTEVLNLVNEFIAKMEKDDIPAAIDMLSILKAKSSFPWSPFRSVVRRLR
jgi:PBP1b-binding outer membrane lipoprotein LpoB